MLRIAIQMVVASADGTPICEVGRNSTVIPRNHKDGPDEVAQTEQRLGELAEDALQDARNQLLDFAKILGQQ